MSQLIDFAQKVPQNPNWIEKYKERTGEIVELLNNTRIENRFGKADMTPSSVFMNSIQNILKESSAIQDSCSQNLRGFFRNLGVHVN